MEQQRAKELAAKDELKGEVAVRTITTYSRL